MIMKTKLRRLRFSLGAHIRGADFITYNAGSIYGRHKPFLVWIPDKPMTKSEVIIWNSALEQANGN